MAQNFKRKIEDFVCGNCGQKVKGDGYTNHCPQCLWSKHVDIHPGDRANTCGGLMAPIAFRVAEGGYDLVQRCQICGLEKRNRTAAEDDLAVLASL